MVVLFLQIGSLYAKFVFLLLNAFKETLQSFELVWSDQWTKEVRLSQCYYEKWKLNWKLKWNFPSVRLNYCGALYCEDVLLDGITAGHCTARMFC